MTKLNTSYATKQLLGGYCGIIFGGFGLHKFILGYAIEGTVMLAVSIMGLIFAYGIPLLIMQLIGLIEGMIYLNKNHEDFINSYFVNRQGWF
ncbi:MAG: TM2 domain-containing protein [Mastigocoleus sp.]